MKKLHVLCGLALCVALAIAIAVVVLAPAPASSEKAEEAGAIRAAVSSPSRASKSLRSGQARQMLPATADPVRLDDARAVIDEAVVTYEPAGVQVIRPFLLDPDPLVRQAARDGMVQLGETDAIPLLRDAAGKLDDPQEVSSLHEGADLLALPPWSETEEARAVVAEILDQASGE